jgi:hypothetical protein
MARYHWGQLLDWRWRYHLPRCHHWQWSHSGCRSRSDQRRRISMSGSRNAGQGDQKMVAEAEPGCCTEHDIISESRVSNNLIPNLPRP